MERDKFDWFMEHCFGWIIGGIFAGFVGAAILTVTQYYSRDKLYVDCLYNMRDRTIDQLEMMCSHLRN